MLGDEVVFGFRLIIYNFLSTLITSGNINNKKQAVTWGYENEILVDAFCKCLYHL